MTDPSLVIDFHAHEFPDKIAPRAIRVLSAASHSQPFTNGTFRGLIRSMERASVAASVVLPVATKAEQVKTINDGVIAFHRRETENEQAFSDLLKNPSGCETLPPAVCMFGTIHPACENWEFELERLAENGIRGVKLHPFYHATNIDDPVYLRILKKCGSLRLIVVCHTGDDIGFPGLVHASPEMTARALDHATNVTFVAAHMGGWKNWDDVLTFLRDTPAYLDTSFSYGAIVPLEGDHTYGPEDTALLSEERFVTMIRAFGAFRILFGTDSPWSDQETSVAQIKALPLSEAEKALILGENARGLLM